MLNQILNAYVIKLNNHYYLYDWNNFYEAEKKTKVIEVWE